MNKYLLFLILCLTLAVLAIIFRNKIEQSEALESQLHQQVNHHAFVVAYAHTLLGFDLVDPNQSPPHIRESVLRGYAMILNTPLYAPDYARDQLSCTNCHFAGGDTLGGKNNGFSLVGVTAIYPRFSEREGREISLAERVNNCFERSLNGRPLPLDSQEMQDILNYLKWISKEVESIPSIPWLGISELKSSHQPDPKQGAMIYQTHCASCHREDGQGGGYLSRSDKTIPPLWGENAFNDGAGMNRLPLFAAFVYENMPYQSPSLTEEQALDVAAFVLQQPRAHFKKKDLNKMEHTSAPSS